MSIRSKALALLLSAALATPLYADGPNNPGGALPGGLGASTACTTWTPTDQSTAGLVFTGVNAQFCRVGNLVFAYGTLTYPTTADANNAAISTPLPVPNQTYAITSSTVQGAGINALITPIPNSSKAQFVILATGVIQTNTNLSAKTLSFIFVYPAT